MEFLEFIQRIDCILNNKQTWFYQTDGHYWNHRGESGDQYSTSDVMKEIVSDIQYLQSGYDDYFCASLHKSLDDMIKS